MKLSGIDLNLPFLRGSADQSIAMRFRVRFDLLPGRRGAESSCAWRTLSACESSSSTSQRCERESEEISSDSVA